MENLERNCFIDILAFEPGKLCPGVGDFVSFFSTRGPEFALESCSWGGDFDRKNSGPGVRRGGDGNRSN